MIKYGTQKDDDLRDAFKVFDQDNNGYIDAAELQTILSNMGENLPMDQVSLFAIKSAFHPIMMAVKVRKLFLIEI